jgi:hypothetical protein
MAYALLMTGKKQEPNAPDAQLPALAISNFE